MVNQRVWLKILFVYICEGPTRNSLGGVCLSSSLYLEIGQGLEAASMCINCMILFLQ